MAENGVKAEELKELYEENTTDVRLYELQGRVKRCCCSYCGNELVLRRITTGREDAGRIEIFCPNCDRIEFGVEKEIYQVAKYYANTLRFDYYPELDDSERKHRMNCAKACEVIHWGCKNLGLLKQDGFAIPLEMDASVLGEDIILTEDDLLQRVQSEGVDET